MAVMRRTKGLGLEDRGLSESAPYRVQVLDRALKMLDILAHADTDLGPTDLAAALSLHRSTTHRLLKVLERHGFIRKGQCEGGTPFGMKLIELGGRVIAQIDLAKRAEPFLRELVVATGETAHVCVLNDTQMVSIANVEGSSTLRTPSTIGRRTAVHCTSVGKAFVAFMSEDEQRELLPRLSLTRYTSRTIVTQAALRAELAKVRDRGFAIDNEEVEAGLRCIGAPIYNQTGRVVGAIGIAGPVFRMTKQQLPALVGAVMTASYSLSCDLGYRRRSGTLVARLKSATGARSIQRPLVCEPKPHGD